MNASQGDYEASSWMPSSATPVFRYPPASPSSTPAKRTLRLRCVTTYRGAINRGNSLLYLPSLVRARIYKLALSQDPRLANIEIPDKGSFCLPELCTVDPIFYREVAELLFVWLNDFDGGYALVSKLELLGLDMFEKGKFAPHSRNLLRRCANVEEISLVIDLRDLAFTFHNGIRYLDMDALRSRYDFASLTTMAYLRTVTLALKPFMALETQLRRMVQGDQAGIETPDEAPGVERFWGLKDWLLANGPPTLVVRCPSVKQILGCRQ